MGVNQPDRRSFLQLAASGFAAAGLAGVAFHPYEPDHLNFIQEQEEPRKEIEGHTELIDLELSGEKIRVAVIKFSLGELDLINANNPSLILQLNDPARGGNLLEIEIFVQDLIKMHNFYKDEKGIITIAVTQSQIVARELENQLGMLVITPYADNQDRPITKLSEFASVTLIASTARSKKIMPQGSQVVLVFESEVVVVKTFNDMGEVIKGENIEWGVPKFDYEDPTQQHA